jgi:hypothetical protein
MQLELKRNGMQIHVKNMLTMMVLKIKKKTLKRHRFETPFQDSSLFEN